MNDDNIRHLLEGSYRIIYEIHSKDEVEILTVFHGGRLLQNKLGNNFLKPVGIRVIITSDLESIDTKFIEELSNSTNQQSRVEEADRRSNDKV